MVRLARHAQQHRNTSVKMLLIDPYGGINMRKVATSQNVMAITGGSGAGSPLSLIEDSCAIMSTNPRLARQTAVWNSISEKR
jgi:hypothetical protein